jgi:RNA polymerase sigma-70 factor, ECF subfamily
VVFARDPFANPEALIRRVYAYAAYRLGDGPDAEDVTSETLERGLRGWKSYDSSRGAVVPWLLGIARRVIAETVAAAPPIAELPDIPATGNLEIETVDRVSIAAALRFLSDRDRELIGLRYGADLTAAQIAELMGSRTNAVEVALHRAMARLHARLVEEGDERAAAPERPAEHRL